MDLEIAHRNEIETRPVGVDHMNIAITNSTKEEVNSYDRRPFTTYPPCYCYFGGGEHRGFPIPVVDPPQNFKSIHKE